MVLLIDLDLCKEYYFLDISRLQKNTVRRLLATGVGGRTIFTYMRGRDLRHSPCAYGSLKDGFLAADVTLAFRRE